MGLFRSLVGTLRLELTSADKESTLRDISDSGIEITNVENYGELSVRFNVSRASLGQIQCMTQRKGERLIILSHEGIFWPLWSLRSRPVLLAGMLLMLVLSLWVPGRVLFVEVEGNGNIPEQLILEAAQTAGIRFGASRRAVRSERMKNELLGSLPQLQWAGVNTYGCRAVISVRERAMEPKESAVPSVSSIVAACDGVITSCTVTRGNGLCNTGQVVQRGQVLISGYVDHGLAVTATRAEGEIFAQTQHELTVVMPSETSSRAALTAQSANYSLLIGKKRINFMKGSGIYDGTCVKMYTEYCLTLPGGYRLPVKLVKETIGAAALRQQLIEEADAKQLLSAAAKQYLWQQHVALSILDDMEDLSCADGRFRLDGSYACTEMIGREQSEEIGDFHGKTD